MVVYNYSGKEINAKIVYYGPALSGKTTNLEWIYSKIPLEYSGKMISLRTQTDRTIFFDFLPLELGLIDGFKTRFMLYTVPGQVYYNATRKMVLKGADGVVFVADSEEGRLADNLESFQNLRENLAEIGIDPDSIPIVLQWNKRDLPATEEVAQLERQLNPEGHPSFNGCALTGEGVYETLHQISRMIYRKLTAEEGASPVPSANAIDENSLFGDDIAECLQDIDEVDPTWEESIRVDPLAAVPTAPPQEGALLDTILGSLGTANADPVPASESEAVAAPQAESAGPSAPVQETPIDSGASERFSLSDALSPLAQETPAPPVTESVAHAENLSTPNDFSSIQPATGEVELPLEIPVGAPSSMEEGAALALSENGGRPTMSDHPAPTTPPQTPQAGYEEAQVAAPAPAAHAAPAAPAQAQQQTVAIAPDPQASAPRASAPRVPVPDSAPDEAVADLVDNLFSPQEEEEIEEDGLAYGSDFGRMVDLGPDSVAGKTPPTEADFELPTDLLESGQFTPVVREDTKDKVEPLELITDPLKSPSEQGSGAPSGNAPSAGSPTGAFQPLSAGTRTIEVPVSVDADLLADGKTLRLVLNLKMRR